MERETPGISKGGRDGAGKRADAQAEHTVVDMLRCHCSVPAPVGCCLDCNIVLYCLLPRCSADRLRGRQAVQIAATGFDVGTSDKRMD